MAATGRTNTPPHAVSRTVAELAPSTPASSSLQQPNYAKSILNTDNGLRGVSQSSAFSIPHKRFERSPRLSPRPLTAAAAMADQQRMREQQERDSRQTSPNPGVSALNALLGQGMSKAKDAPAAATTLSEPLQRVAQSITIPEGNQSDAPQTSPVSLSSFGTVDSTTAPTVTAMDTRTAGPLVAEGVAPHQRNTSDLSSSAAEEAPSSRAFTFPPPLPLEQEQQRRDPVRGMSLPMSNYGQNSPKSPTTKRHKCPYCSTDFTRHHNLKSHLLTHSQEKPYVCQTCQARFRRLHDLKRHTKLHTGERPHTCSKCGRKFARGDALARHTKGAGGCAGRRASFGNEDDYESKTGDESMEGIQYNGLEGNNDDRMDEDEHPPADDRRRVSEPSSRTQRPSLDAGVPTPRGPHTQSSYHQHGSTYPPVAGRLMPTSSTGSGVRGMYPPPVAHPGSSTATSPREPSLAAMSPSQQGSSISSIHFTQTNPSILAGQTGITESPKPLSPGQTDAHRLSIAEHANLQHPTRAGSLNQPQHQGSPYARPPPTGRGTPHIHQQPPVTNSNAPQLPPLTGLGNMPMSSNPPSASGSRTPTLTSGLAGQQPLPPPHGHSTVTGVPGSQHGSISSHGQSSGGSMREYLGGRDTDLWAYIRSLEERMQKSNDEHERRVQKMQHDYDGHVRSLQERIGHLENRITVLTRPQQPGQ